MLISCKCLNFIASSNTKQQAAVATADAAPRPPAAPAAQTPSAHVDGAAAHAASGQAANNNLYSTLMHTFLQKYPRNFVFYSQCMDFFKQLLGPISDLSINAVSQRELVYSLTLEVPIGVHYQSWQLMICINCNVALCAKRMGGGGHAPHQYLVNSSLVTSNDELMQRRSDKSYSETFGLLIMDHPQLAMQNGNHGPPSLSTQFSVGSMSSGQFNMDPKQQRLRQVQLHLQQRLTREIAETDERIQRYTEQQFALLKSFREKSEQEYEMLTRLIQRVPEQQSAAGAWLDPQPPTLEIVGGITYNTRRRNTIGSRRDLYTGPPTPTNPQPPTAISAIETQGATLSLGPVASSGFGSSNTTVSTTTIIANRKMAATFDTPPATPEAIPMSVGNSPTFRQQQQQGAQQLPLQQFVRVTNTQTFQQQFPTPTAEQSDDCFFELEEVDGEAHNPPPVTALSFNLAQNQYHQSQQQHHNHQHHPQIHQHFQRSLSSHQESNMSDLEESDGAEEAEDALHLEDSSMPIPMLDASGRRAVTTPAHILNYAKSLPIEIANSPMAERSYIGDSIEEELDNTVDIAASIKALAKSVRGEAVFGDLPRPRLRSQI